MSNGKLASLLAIAGFTIASCSTGEIPARMAEMTCERSVVSGPAVEKIRALEQAGAAGNVLGVSRSQVEEMYWPDYVSIGPDGKVESLETILNNWRPQAWASRFDIYDLDIKVYCDMAIAVGLSEALPVGATENTKPTRFGWLNVWTKADNEWRLSATQFTRF